MFVLLYFLMIRPQQKREKKVKSMLAELKMGDRVVTIGGVYGRVCAIKDDIITLEVGADKVKIPFMRRAISSVDESGVEAELVS